MCYIDLNLKGSKIANMIKHECGICGIYSQHESVARLTFFSLHALQHRGQESSGIAVLKPHKIECHKKLGLVSNVYDENIIEELDLNAIAAIGHNRYSTTGTNNIHNSQPIVKQFGEHYVAVAHNGNLINAQTLREDLEAEGHVFESTSDTEIIAFLLMKYHDLPVKAIVSKLYEKLRGAYSLVMILHGKVVALRDHYGIRPLCVGRIETTNTYCVASESCAFTPIGAKFIREVENGEVIIIDENGMESYLPRTQKKCKLCLFEFLYIARPDSVLNNDMRVHKARYKFGKILAIEHPCPGADMVIPVPDTSIPCAQGYSKQSKIPYADCIIKNRYIHRTFIQPDQRMRDMGALIKYSPLDDRINGAKIVLIDDSIVRGTTIKKLVKMLKGAGAAEVHLRIQAPPIICPCFYGVDMGTYEELIAANHSIEDICKMVEADSLGYLSLKAIKEMPEFSKNVYCRACFGGRYPITLPNDNSVKKQAFE